MDLNKFLINEALEIFFDTKRKKIGGREVIIMFSRGKQISSSSIEKILYKKLKNKEFTKGIRNFKSDNDVINNVKPSVIGYINKNLHPDIMEIEIAAQKSKEYNQKLFDRYVSIFNEFFVYLSRYVRPLITTKEVEEVNFIVENLIRQIGFIIVSPGRFNSLEKILTKNF